jgi:SAM-dependent methyltransferase
MTQDRTTTLFFEMFSGLPRQGPGDSASTLKALALVPGVGSETRVLDLGCGTGLQTRVLAQHSPARFVAIDNHPPFVHELNGYARALGIADRLEARVADMHHLEYPPGSFDVIWCEGAIWVVGFEAGLREWRRLLVPGGHAAVTEVCWTRSDPPPECRAFWDEEYPAIRDASALLAMADECGYETVGHFVLPPSSWWDEYYAPLQRNLTAFRGRHRAEADAEELADRVQREIDIWHTYSEFYSHEFLVMRAR